MLIMLVSILVIWLKGKIEELRCYSGFH